MAFVYMEIKNDLSSFVKLYKLVKQNKMLSQRNILKFLSYASVDLPMKMKVASSSLREKIYTIILLARI